MKCSQYKLCNLSSINISTVNLSSDNVNVSLLNYSNLSCVSMLCQNFQCQNASILIFLCRQQMCSFIDSCSHLNVVEWDNTNYLIGSTISNLANLKNSTINTPLRTYI